MKLTEKQFLSKLEEHKGILLKVSRIYFDDSEDQKDLVQEIILQLWKSHESFKGNSQFSTWVYQVAINTALLFFKKYKRKPKQIPIAKHDLQAESVYDHKYEKQLDQFYQAAQQLSKIEKALIFLYLEGQTGEQVAKTLGMSASNARVKLNRTKNKLKGLLKVNANEIR